MQTSPSLLDRLLDPWPAATWGVSAWIFASLWRRFQSRTAPFNWEAQHSPAAFSASDRRFGTIQVLHNGQPAGNVSVLRFRLTNDSSSDFAGITLSLGYRDGTHILSDAAECPDQNLAIGYTEQFLEAYNRASLGIATDPDIAMCDTQRAYTIPVLNRGESIVVFVFVARSDRAPPQLVVSCPHKGVRLRENHARQRILGAPIEQALVVGLLLGLSSILAYGALSDSAQTLPLALAFLAGALCTLLGALLLLSGRLLLKALA
jgi:hypothetical protein